MSLKEEIEVRILDIDPLEVSNNILEKGGQLVFSGIQERDIFEIPNAGSSKSWLRLRSAETGTTLAIKIDKGGVVEELEVEVSDHAAMLGIFRALGVAPRAHHQTHRSLYQLPGEIEVSIDTWPQLDPFLEIEGPSIEAVMTAVALLGLDTEQITPMNIVQIYEQEGIMDIVHTDLVFTPSELDRLNKQ
ncbi:MAG: CYTH domain-containing protein [Patescibacteria group bacterium]